MFFKKKKEKKSKYTEGFNTAYFNNESFNNPYNCFNNPEEHREWFIGFTDGINNKNITSNKNIFNYQSPKCSG